LQISPRKTRSTLGRIAAALLLFGSTVLALFPTASAPEALAAGHDLVAQLSGPAESPPNNSPGSGFAHVEIDPAAHTMRVQISFSGLTAPTTASHIHACTPSPRTGTAGVATQTPNFAGFPTGVTSGIYESTFQTLETGTYNPDFISANGGTAASAEQALFQCINSGRAYVNIHTTAFPRGEIRGFLTQTQRSSAMPVEFGLPGSPLDPPAGAGGATRDRVVPEVIVIESGQTVFYENEGAPHQLAIYDKNLTKNGTTAPTTLLDVNDSAGTGTLLDDPVGRLGLASPGADVYWTFTNTSGSVEQYLVICAFRPHFQNFAMAQFILVRP
jgi:hypothetical protein